MSATATGALRVVKAVGRAACLLLFCAPFTLALPGSGQPRAGKKLGEVNFPVSCRASLQEPFDQAVAMLHSFDYSVARSMFLEIARDDPKCAMAHWGAAMTYYHELWDPRITPADFESGRLEIEKAQRLGAGSPRERGFIDALAAFYQGPSEGPYPPRALAYEKAMAALARRNPQDAESQIFYALAILSTASSADRTHKNQLRAAAILEPLFHRYPHHPGAAHYLIHAYDSPELAPRGLAAARAYSQIAPSAPHALHMPSHIFTQLGLWRDSIRSNTAARAAARDEGEVGEELHAMDYLMYAYLQTGLYGAANRLLGELRAMPAKPVDQFKVGYAATAMPARYAIERSDWRRAAALAPDPRSAPQVQAIACWARAVGLARSGHPEAAKPELDNLKKFLSQLREKKDDYWSAQVEIQLREAQAWIALAEGQGDRAASLMRSAATEEDGLEKRPITPGPVVPAREQLGDLLLALNRNREALNEFEASLRVARRRRGALSGAARAAKLDGDTRKAAQFESEFAALGQ